MKMLVKTIALSIGFALVAFAALAWTPGDFLFVQAGCVGVDLDFMEDFTAAVIRGGYATYTKMIQSPDIPCYDVRILSNTEPVQVRLKEKLWKFEVLGGEKLNMWLAEDSAGTPGYVWIRQEGLGI